MSGHGTDEIVMKKSKRKIKDLIPIFLLITLAVIILSACNTRSTHLTQNLENSRVPGQRLTPTFQETAELPEQESSQLQPSSTIVESTSPTTALPETQVGSITPAPVLTQTPSPVVTFVTTILTPTKTRTSTPIQTAATTSTLTQSATPTRTATATPTKTATATPTKTATATPTKTATATPPITATATPTKTATATPTRTATPTVTEQTGWQGEWIVYWEHAAGSYVSGSMSLEITGLEISGTLFLNGIGYDVEGMIYESQLVFGNWSANSNTGIFHWKLLTNGQFGGSRDRTFGFCGTRQAVGMPDPCYIAPPED